MGPLIHAFTFFFFWKFFEKSYEIAHNYTNCTFKGGKFSIFQPNFSLKFLNQYFGNLCACPHQWWCVLRYDMFLMSKYSHFLLNYLKYKNFLKLDAIEKSIEGFKFKIFFRWEQRVFFFFGKKMTLGVTLWGFIFLIAIFKQRSMNDIVIFLNPHPNGARSL
jgi:hypothetical protein